MSGWTGKTYCTGTAGGYTSGCRCLDCTRGMKEMTAARRKRIRYANAEPESSTQWMSQGSCKGHPTDWWYAYPNTRELAKAVDICATCPVKAQCADHGKRNAEVGLWGGFYRVPDRVAGFPGMKGVLWRDLVSGRSEKVSR